MTNSHLTIQHGERRKILNAVLGRIEILLPVAFFGTLNIQTISGKITADMRLTLHELNISTTSGRISLGEVMSGTAVIASISGAISVYSLCAHSHVSSISGSIRIPYMEGKGHFESISGSVEFTIIGIADDIQAMTTSGRIRIGVSSRIAAFIDAKSTTGSVHLPITETISGEKRSQSGFLGKAPSAKLTLRSVSGRIESYLCQ